MNDPIADMLLEEAQEAEQERAARKGIEERLASVESRLDRVMELLLKFTQVQPQSTALLKSRNGKIIFTVIERDENERIQSIEVK